MESEGKRFYHAAVRTGDPDLYEQYRQSTRQTKPCVKTEKRNRCSSRKTGFLYNTAAFIGGHYGHT